MSSLEGKVGNISCAHMAVDNDHIVILYNDAADLRPEIYGRNSAIALAEMDILTPYTGIPEGLAEVAAFLV